MTCTENASAALRMRGFRLTPQRMLIMHILNDTNGHLSPLEVFERARASMPGITEPTVYRTLEFLEQNDLVVSAHIGSGRIVYEANAHDHHHIICRACGKTAEVDHVALQAAYSQLENATGYKLTMRHSTFFGLCPNCQSHKT